MSSPLPDRRKDIIKAAVFLFDRRGYANTTIDAVATAAGISKGSIYNYFRSKHALFTQVVTEAFAQDQALMDDILSARMPPVDKLSKTIDTWFGRIEHHRRIGRLILEFWAVAARDGEKGDWTVALKTYTRQWIIHLAAILRQGETEGEFRLTAPPEVGAALIVSLIRGLTLQAVLDPREAPTAADVTTVMKRAIVDLLTARVERRSA